MAKSEPPYMSEIFDKYGPLHLKNVDWSKVDQRKSIAAALVEAVYILENDRQQQRIAHDALAPIWWEFFHFQCIEKLVDQSNDSIIGAIFEYKPHNPDQDDADIQTERHPPKYVIALRGTFLKLQSFVGDLLTDMELALNQLTQSKRYRTCLRAVEGIIAKKVSPEKIWLTGHSLGAALALQVGKTMARDGRHIDAYLFNPPFISVPLEMLNYPKARTGIRVAFSAITALLNAKKTTDHSDSFSTLRTWIPRLFVNQNDPICSGYIWHFEHRRRMESWGLGFVASVAAGNSFLSLLRDNNSRDFEAPHLIPSADLVKNLNPMEDGFKLAHSIHQWWAPHTNWSTINYSFT